MTSSDFRLCLLIIALAAGCGLTGCPDQSPPNESGDDTWVLGPSDSGDEPTDSGTEPDSDDPGPIDATDSSPDPPPPPLDADPNPPEDATTQRCQIDRDCPGNQACVRRRCRTGVDGGGYGGACQRDRNCPRGFECYARGCEQRRESDTWIRGDGGQRILDVVGRDVEVDCLRDRHCPENQICLHARCQPELPPPDSTD